jgi:hypothetical protein
MLSGWVSMRNETACGDFVFPGVRSEAVPAMVPANFCHFSAKG